MLICNIFPVPGQDWMRPQAQAVRMTARMAPLVHLTEVVHQAADPMKVLEIQMSVQAALWLQQRTFHLPVQVRNHWSSQKVLEEICKERCAQGRLKFRLKKTVKWQSPRRKRPKERVEWLKLGKKSKKMFLLRHRKQTSHRAQYVWSSTKCGVSSAAFRAEEASKLQQCSFSH